MQIASGRQLADWLRCAFAVALTVCLLVWSVTPSFTHSASYLKGLSEQSQTIAEHGHSHGDEMDEYWTLHGHSHDVADHDHSSAILTLAYDTHFITGFQLPRALKPSLDNTDPIYLLERPPRV